MHSFKRKYVNFSTSPEKNKRIYKEQQPSTKRVYVS